MMSREGETEEAIQDAMVRLLAGHEPRPGWLARCPTLEDWDLSVRADRSGSRRIVIRGRLKSDRFTVHDIDVACIPVLWMDRRWKFALTAEGMRNLGDRLQDITERGLFTND
jgi:hypothetical protein